MVTAWSPAGAPRTRSWAGPTRLLWVAMLLLGLYAHGVSAEGVTDHLSSAVVAGETTGTAQTADTADTANTAATADTAATSFAGASAPGTDAAHTVSEEAVLGLSGPGGQGTSHPVQECLPGQPEPGPDVAAPCASPLGVERTSPAQPLGAAALNGNDMTRSSLRASTGSAVLRL